MELPPLRREGSLGSDRRSQKHHGRGIEGERQGEAVRSPNSSESSALPDIGGDRKPRKLIGTTIHAAAKRNRLDVLQDLILVDRADINAKDAQEMTSLHHASKRGNEVIVDFLIKNHANVNIQNQTGWTPLSLAIQNRRQLVAKTLLRSLADPCIPSSGNVTPLHRAAALGEEELANLLVRAGASFVCCDTLRRDTLVHYAASQGHASIIRFFVGESRKWLDMINDWGQTLLHVAAESGFVDIVDYALRFGSTENWRKEFVNRKDRRNGDAALHLAVKSQQVEVVKVLAKFRLCDFNQLNDLDQSPLHLSVTLANVQIQRVLLAAGANTMRADVDLQLPTQLNISTETSRASKEKQPVRTTAATKGKSWENEMRRSCIPGRAARLVEEQRTAEIARVRREHEQMELELTRRVVRIREKALDEERKELARRLRQETAANKIAKMFRAFLVVRQERKRQQAIERKRAQKEAAKRREEREKAKDEMAKLQSRHGDHDGDEGEKQGKLS
mmetsp:Transcript_4795/g.11386  ORF Transcript_4795/g.11386 Transcript_4795/m.11386 type:complete len:505 (-) Transcript_4795:1465-2979(-)